MFLHVVVTPGILSRVFFKYDSILVRQFQVPAQDHLLFLIIPNAYDRYRIIFQYSLKNNLRLPFFFAAVIIKIPLNKYESIEMEMEKMGVSGNILYKKNISLLKKNHPAAWDAISTENGQPQKDSYEMEVVFSENQRPNLRVKQGENELVLIHDREHPGKEGESFLSMVGKESTGVVLILGMGLGYLPLALLEQRKKIQQIIIFELNIDVFCLALKHMDFSAFFCDKRVTLSIGYPEDIDALLSPAKRSLLLEDIYTNKLVPFFNINRAYEKLALDVFSLVSNYNIEGATKSIHGKTFVENRLKHLTSMHHDNRLDELKNKFEGLPAIIIAAGPSLDNNIRDIQGAVGKAVLICVDTALPVLFRHGITPDFVTSIDYNAPTYEKIADLALDPKSREINLICTSWVTEKVPKIFPVKTIFWAFGDSALENWINEAMGGKMSIGGAGTVAHLNFLAAKTMGCDPVVFVGQDLAYSYTKEHASQVVFTGSLPLENMQDDVLMVKGVNEPEVPTTRSMHGYRKLFEDWIRISKGKVINATEGGAWIEGAENMALSRVVDMFCRDDICVDFNQASIRKDLSKAMVSMLKKVDKVERIVVKSDRLARIVLREVDKINGKKRLISNINMLPRKLHKQIITLDTLYNQADAEPFWEMFNEMTMEGLRQDEREKNEIDQLEGNPKKYMEWLQKSVGRTDRVNAIRQETVKGFKNSMKKLIAFYRDEKAVLDRAVETSIAQHDMLKLAQIYYENGDYTLLDNLLISCEGEESGAVHFYLGMIALHRCGYDTAEEHFIRAVELEPAYNEKILSHKRKMADFYYTWAQTEPVNSLTDLRDKNGIYYRLKGIRLFAGHELLQKEFCGLADKELQKINRSIKERGGEALSEHRQCLEGWLEFIENEVAAPQCIPIATAISFFRFYGKLLIDGKESQQALELYEKAMQLIPHSPEICIAATDVCFAIQNFNAGVQYLKMAVSLDKNYAVYWKNIGENLYAQGDYNGSLQAYEQFHAAQPEQIEILRNVADCYLKLGNAEKADEVKLRYGKLKNSDSI